jgi:hypothetical protein
VNFCVLTQRLLVSLISIQCLAQGPHSAKTAESTQSAKQPNRELKLTPEQQRGWRLLKSAEADAAGLEPDMRAFVLWRASYAYVPVDPKKAESLAKDSFVASEAIEDPPDKDQCGPIGSAGDIKSWIQERVLSDMIKKDRIAQVEEMLPSATAPVQNRITTELVRHYVTTKDLGRAQALLTQLAESDQYPYDAASDLLLAMGPEQAADRMTVFGQALNNFEQHGTANGIGMEDLGTLIERTWKELPPSVVLEAINKMLEEAKSKESHSRFSIASEKGSVNLNSTYELRLFQLLPVLDELDKDRAERLLNENRDIQPRLAKYPKGMASITSEGNIYSYGITDDDSSQASQSASREQAGQQAEQQIVHRISEIGKESEKDPQQAVNDAMMLPVQDMSQNSSPRAEALLMVARNAEKKKPSLAKSALDEIMKFEDQLTPAEVRGIADVPRVYLEMGDADSAGKALKPILKAAEKLYAHDTDADDPNKAFKGTWPSADLWRKCVQIAAKISPPLAEEVIGEIPDADISASIKIAYASTLLGQTSGVPILVSDCRKNGSSYNFSN